MTNLRVLAILLLLVSGLAQAQETVGRVLYSYGTVSATRNGAVVGLAPSSPVLEGDQLRTGVFSLLQVRMSDGALVALKANTEFVIEAYRYRPQTLQLGAGATAGAERSNVLLRLVRGGFRTVSGAVGKLNRDEYKVTTPILALGIRGTDYSVLYCDKSCRAAEDGLHAKVTTGVIALEKPDGSEFLLRAGEYAFVGPGSLRPFRRLKAPEEIETDGPQEAAEPSQVSYESPVSAENTATTAAPDKSSTTSSSTNPRSSASESLTAQPLRAEEPAIASGSDTGPGAALKGPFTPVAFSFVGTFDASEDGTVPADDYAGSGYSQTSADTLVVDGGGRLVELRFFDDEDQTTTVLRPTAITDVGSDAATGLNWGRWTGTTVDGQRSTTGEPLGTHYVYGASIGPTVNDLPVLPRTGSASYRLIGSTAPTDINGNSGTITAATLAANFSTVTLNHSLTASIGGNTVVAQSVNNAFGTPGSSSNLGFFGDNYDSITVNGQAITSPANSYSGVFVGSSGATPTGAAISYGIDTGNGAPFGGVLVFGDPTPGP